MEITLLDPLPHKKGACSEYLDVIIGSASSIAMKTKEYKFNLCSNYYVITTGRIPYENPMKILEQPNEKLKFHW